MLLWPGVHKQHPVLTRLFNHAHVQIVLRCPLLIPPFGSSTNQACEEGFAVVAVVPRNIVDGPAGRDDSNRSPEASLHTN